MDLDSGMNLLYLCLLLAFVVSGVILNRRFNLRQAARAGLSWMILLLLLVAGYGLWDEVRSSDSRTMRMEVQGSSIEIPRARDGHFYLALQINGTSVPMLVDTGATELVLTRRDAERAGLNMNALTFTGRAMTANGEVRTAPVRLEEVALGPVKDTGVRAWVNEGEMDRSLLGMSYLQRWERMEITRDALILTR